MIHISGVVADDLVDAEGQRFDPAYLQWLIDECQLLGKPVHRDFNTGYKPDGYVKAIWHEGSTVGVDIAILDVDIEQALRRGTAFGLGLMLIDPKFERGQDGADVIVRGGIGMVGIVTQGYLYGSVTILDSPRVSNLDWAEFRMMKRSNGAKNST